MTTYPKASDLQRATESRLTANPPKGANRISHQMWVIRDYRSEEYWSHKTGWGSLEEATKVFTPNEKFRKPTKAESIGRDAKWEIVTVEQEDDGLSFEEPIPAHPKNRKGVLNPVANPPARAIQDGMERAIWVVCFANWVDEQGPSARKKYGAGPGEDWNDVAPSTPDSASEAAMELANLYRLSNGKDLLKLLADAAFADGAAENEVDTGDEYADAFGHALAMMAMGTGVSWFDDHAQFRLKVPGFEAYCPDGMDLDWSPKKLSTQNPAKTRGGNAVSINYEPVDLGDEVVWSVNSVDAVADDAIGQFSQHDTEKAAKAHAYAAAEELRSAGYDVVVLNDGTEERAMRRATRSKR